MTVPFLMYQKSESSEFLHNKPIANHVLLIIAHRARRTVNKQNGLQPGQCYMGDFATIGITRQQYRTAISNLQKWNYITTKTTSAGTIVTLAGSDAWDINTEIQPSTQPDNNQQPNQEPTIDQPSGQPLTNKVNKATMQQSNKTHSEIFTDFWLTYPGHRRGNKKRAWIEWQKIDDIEYPLIIENVKQRMMSDPDWLKDNGKYISHAERFLSGVRWQNPFSIASGQSERSIKNQQAGDRFLAEMRQNEEL